MKNYIKINNQKIKLTDEQVREIQESFNLKGVKLSDVAVGDTFKVGRYEFIVLEHTKETTAVILKDLLFDSKQFGINNNFNGSYIDDICKNFENEIAGIIGKDNLVEHTVDLTSDDGLKDYGKIKRRVSLLTANLYRRYVETLDKYPVKKWWWLVTAYSTPKHDNSVWVKCVSPSGRINGHSYDGYGGGGGVRPFCIFSSNIFVSK